jgi:hypothetical protein
MGVLTAGFAAGGVTTLAETVDASVRLQTSAVVRTRRFLIATVLE